MTRYAERTEVSSDRSRAEIEKTLRRYGTKRALCTAGLCMPLVASSRHLSGAQDAHLSRQRCP